MIDQIRNLLLLAPPPARFSFRRSPLGKTRFAPDGKTPLELVAGVATSAPASAAEPSPASARPATTQELFPRNQDFAKALCGLVVCTCLEFAVRGRATAADTSRQSFVLPWNDGIPGITSLAGWQGTPAGSSGWVTVDANGHFAAGAERIRFLGVNIVAESAFPEPGPAAAAAARLAKFGINCVRLHHLEAPWAPRPLTDYRRGDSGHFDPESFARLHDLVRQLKARGIYSDLNLMCSRQFFPSDGLPTEITQLSWKDQHVLVFFDDTMLALQKDHARRLLTEPGPNGEPPFAQDPAVAFVEILNENGAIQKWDEGVLDTLPEVFQAKLRARWNAWLRTHYPDTSALRKSWGGVQAPREADLLANGDFSHGLQAWKTSVNPGASVDFSVKKKQGRQGLRVKIRKFGTDWDAGGVTHGGLHLEPGKLYTLSFAAQTTAPGQLYVSLRSTGGSASVESRLVQATVSNDWRRFRTAFVAPEGSGEAALDFGGFSSVGECWIAEVKVQPGGELAGVSAGVSLEAGDIPTVPHGTIDGPTPTEAARLDWLRFLTDLEHRYWRGMQAYVKETLGYRGLVFGTIISNSPPNVQGGLDVVDGHSYWLHVRFPAGAWDEEKWVLFGRSMTGDPEHATIGDLARQRVLGRPFTVTEYQHSAPNPFAAEGPVLAAAYGAFQDWDGIWFFDYRIPTTAGLGDYAGRFADYFDDSQHPAKMANYLLAAALFRRFDVAPARDAIVVPFPPERELEILATRGGQWNVANAGHLGLSGLQALTRRIALDVGPETAGRASQLPLAPPAAPYLSDTGELSWHLPGPGKGLVEINTPRTKALIGAVDGVERRLGEVTFGVEKTRLGWATLGLTLLAGESFAADAGGRALLIATGEVENTGMGWTDATHSSVGRDWGRAPTLIETVKGSVTLPVAASRVTVFALDGTGQRMAPVPVHDAGGQAGFIFGASGVTLWYEVVIAPAR